MKPAAVVRDTRQARRPGDRLHWPSARFGPLNHEWLHHAIRLGGKGPLKPLPGNLIGWQMGKVAMVLDKGHPRFMTEGEHA